MVNAIRPFQSQCLKIDNGLPNFAPSKKQLQFISKSDKKCHDFINILSHSESIIVSKNTIKCDSHFVIGGARSGKSLFAEGLVADLAEKRGLKRHYLATAEAFDEEMEKRIQQHIEQRGTGWQTIQEPLHIADALSSLSSNDVVLVDCLTLWANNLIHYQHDHMAAIDTLCTWLEAPTCHVVLVSNEIGQGLVPMDKLSRQFRDISGTMNQAVAKKAKKVTFISAGLPLTLKDE